MVLLALAAAQGRGSDMAGTMGQGGAGTMASQHAASVTPSTSDQSGDAARQGAAIDAMSSMHMSDGMAGHSAMSAHMAWSDTRPATDADRERAREIVKTLQAALAKYKDYHVAEADGFKAVPPGAPAGHLSLHAMAERAEGGIHLRSRRANLVALQENVRRRL